MPYTEEDLNAMRAFVKANKKVAEIDPSLAQGLINKHKETQNPLQSMIDQANTDRVDSNYGISPLTPDQMGQSVEIPMARPEENPVDAFIPPSASGLPPLLDEQLVDTTPKPTTVQPVITDNQTSDQLQNDQEQQLDPFQQKQADENAAAIAQYGSGKSLVDSVNRTPAVVPQPENASKLPSPEQVPTQDGLSRASDADIRHNLLFGMLKAGQMAGSALAGTKADTSYADAELLKDKAHATKYKTDMDVREEQRNIDEKTNRRDPKSKISKFYQDLVKGFDPKINTDGLSADQLVKIVPQLDAIAARLQIAKDNREAKKDASQAKFDAAKQNAIDKSKAGDEKSITKLADNMDINKFKSREMGGQQLVIGLRARHALDLLNMYPDLDKIPEALSNDVKYALASAIKGSALTAHDVEALTDSTIMGNASKQLSKLLNKPVPAKQGEFLRMYGAALQKQQKTAYEVLRTHADQAERGNKELIKRNPEAWQDLKQGFLDQLQPTEVSSLKSNKQEKQSVIPKASNQGLIAMIAPDGKTIHIPANKVEEAKKDGLKVK